jgi:hypothetical protein
MPVAREFGEANKIGIEYIWQLSNFIALRMA